jgi:hypothetical protein
LIAKVSFLDGEGFLFDGEGLLTEPSDASVRDLGNRSKEARVPNKFSDRKDENTV